MPTAYVEEAFVDRHVDAIEAGRQITEMQLPMRKKFHFRKLRFENPAQTGESGQSGCPRMVGY